MPKKTCLVTRSLDPFEERERDAQTTRFSVLFFLPPENNLGYFRNSQTLIRDDRGYLLFKLVLHSQEYCGLSFHFLGNPDMQISCFGVSNDIDSIFHAKFKMKTEIDRGLI